MVFNPAFGNFTTQALLRDPEEVSCPICRSQVYQVAMGAGIGERIVRCPVCSLLYRNPRPRESYFQEDFRKEWTERCSTHYLGDYRRYHFSRLSRLVLEYSPNPGTILDIGASYGNFLAQFPASWQRVGIEPSTRACDTAAKAHGIRMINTFLAAAPLPDNFADVITMIDTVYYLHQPWRDFSKVRNLLKPEGIFLVECPNFAYRIFTYKIAKKQFSPSIMYFYSPTTLSRMLANSGMQVVNRFAVPSSGVGFKNPLWRCLFWGEYYLARLISQVSAGKLEEAPRFILIARKDD